MKYLFEQEKITNQEVENFHKNRNKFRIKLQKIEIKKIN